MSTRSYICIERPDGTYKGSYCHNDGYLTHNGAMLLDHYQNRDRVNKLIDYGDMSCLRPKISPNPFETHDFEHRQSDVCVFYGRDRNERNVGPKDVDLNELNDSGSWIDYCYVYGLDNKWKFFICHENKKVKLRDLEEGLKDEFRELGIKRPEGVYGYYTEHDIDIIRGLQAEAEM